MRGLRVGLGCLVLVASASPVLASGRPDDAVVVSLPFLEVAEPNRIYVDLAPDGAEPFPLLLDTGAGHSLMTPLAARRAGVSVRRIKSTPYRRATSAGRDLAFWVDTRRSDTGSRTPEEFGVVGGNFLLHYVVELEFSGRRVRLLDPKRFSVPESGEGEDDHVVPIQGSTRPVIEIEIGGHRLPVLVDTGSPGAVLLSGKAARAAGIDVDALPEFGTSQTVMGPMALRFYEAPELKIGPFTFRNVPVKVAPKGWYGMAGETDDSVIGYDLLSRFLVRIDYPEQRMWLRRQSDAVPYLGVDYAATRQSGAFLSPWPGLYRIDFVVPDSPASRLGLRAGDLIEKRPGTKTPEDLLRSIHRGEPVRVIRVSDDVRTDVLLESPKDVPPQ